MESGRCGKSDAERVRYAEGWEEGRQEGRQEGRKEERLKIGKQLLEIARTMLDGGISLDKIARATKIPPGKLKKELRVQ